jgi:hypothetical protein
MVHGMFREKPPVLQTPTKRLDGSIITVGSVFVVNVQGFRTGPGTSPFPDKSWPAVTVTVNGRRSPRRTFGVSVRMSFVGPFHANVWAGANVHVTVPVAMGSLNRITIAVSVRTKVAPLAGVVLMMKGDGHSAVKPNPDPGGSGFPVMSEPTTVTAYGVQTVNGVAWVSVRTVSPADQFGVRVNEGAIEAEVTLVFIRSENVMMIAVVTATPVAPSVGLVDTIVGERSTIVAHTGSDSPCVVYTPPARSRR